ncbi:MAG: hypothetical protein IKR81_16665, partial [Victivallales bacterium]|nr:hypothetical protein [Victivallales bacterium]
MSKSFLLILAMMLALNACVSQKNMQNATPQPAQQPTQKAAENPAQNAAQNPVPIVSPAPKASAVGYQPPRLSDADSWTMVVIPDVQAYVERPCNHGIVDIMHTWILDNLDELRIQQVLYTGDLVYRNDQKDLTPNRHSLLGKEQWKAFSRLMERMD